MRSPRPDERPLQIQITGRNVLCETHGDRELLAQAKAIVANASAADAISLDNLYSVRSTCQLYALGKAQRAVKIAIDTRTLPERQ
jgi:hypothetical protein